MLREDPAYAEKAARVSALAKDITEYLAGIEMPAPGPARPDVAYHSACSMQHGQKITTQPKDCSRRRASTVKDPPEGHLCCGSAGTYNIMQPEIARTLRDRKVSQHRADAAGRDRHRQHRLHDPDRRRHADPDHSHGRTARLGLWRRKPAGMPDIVGRSRQIGRSCRVAACCRLRRSRFSGKRKGGAFEAPPSVFRVVRKCSAAAQPPKMVPSRSMSAIGVKLFGAPAVGADHDDLGADMRRACRDARHPCSSSGCSPTTCSGRWSRAGWCHGCGRWCRGRPCRDKAPGRRADCWAALHIGRDDPALPAFPRDHGAGGRQSGHSALRPTFTVPDQPKPSRPTPTP
jgi:hypothetical protein